MIFFLYEIKAKIIHLISKLIKHGVKNLSFFPWECKFHTQIYSIPFDKILKYKKSSPDKIYRKMTFIIINLLTLWDLCNEISQIFSYLS